MSVSIEERIVEGRRLKYRFQKLRNQLDPPQYPYTSFDTVNCYVSPEEKTLRDYLTEMTRELDETIATNRQLSSLPYIVIEAIKFCREDETLEDLEVNNDYELATLLLIAGWDFAKVAEVIARTQEQEDDDLIDACFDYGEKVARAVYKKDFVREGMEAMSLWKHRQDIAHDEIDPHKLGLGSFCY